MIDSRCLVLIGFAGLGFISAREIIRHGFDLTHGPRTIALVRICRLSGCVDQFMGFPRSLTLKLFSKDFTTTVRLHLLLAIIGHIAIRNYRRSICPLRFIVLIKLWLIISMIAIRYVELLQLKRLYDSWHLHLRLLLLVAGLWEEESEQITWIVSTLGLDDADAFDAPGCRLRRSRRLIQFELLLQVRIAKERTFSSPATWLRGSVRIKLILDIFNRTFEQFSLPLQVSDLFGEGLYQVEVFTLRWRRLRFYH